MTATYLTVTDTAKLLRAALRAEFPGVKFSVRSSRYAGGASITIGWTDGPTVRAVDTIGQRYAGCTFDGMTDMKEYHRSLVVLPGDDFPTLVSYGANFVSTSRTISHAMVERLCLHTRPVRIGDGFTCAYCAQRMTGYAWAYDLEPGGRWPAGETVFGCCPNHTASYAGRFIDAREVMAR